MTILTLAVMGLSILYALALVQNEHKWLVMADYLPIISFSMVLYTFFFEVTLWQFYPLYFVACMGFSITLVRRYLYKRFKSKAIVYRNRRKTIAIIFSAVILSMVLYLAFPVYALPQPTGPQHVGTMVLDLVDENRVEHYGNSQSPHRKIKIQIWYPSTSIDHGEKVPWIYDGVPTVSALAKSMNLPKFTLNHTLTIDSNSYLEPPVSTEQSAYPIVLLSHGWTGTRNLHTDMAENLASHGIVVIGIEHAYGSIATVLENGEVFLLDASALPNRQAATFLEKASVLVETYAMDIAFVLDQLPGIQTGMLETPIKGHLALEKIGLLGHSTGGGAGVKIAITDNRVNALFGLDAWVEPLAIETLEKGLPFSSVFFRSAHWEKGPNNENLYALSQSSLSAAKVYQISGTEHADFTMAYMFSRLTGLFNITGSVHRTPLIETQNEMILEYFKERFEM